MAIWNKDIETMPREKLEELQLKETSGNSQSCI